MQSSSMRNHGKTLNMQHVAQSAESLIQALLDRPAAWPAKRIITKNQKPEGDKTPPGC